MNKGTAFDPLQDAKKQQNSKETSKDNKSDKKDDKLEKKEDSEYEYDEEWDDAETVKSVKNDQGITAQKDQKEEEINKLYDKYVNKEEKQEDKKDEKKFEQKTDEKKDLKTQQQKDEIKDLKIDEKKEDKPVENKFNLADFRKQQSSDKNADTGQKVDSDQKIEASLPQDSKVINPIQLDEKKLDQQSVADSVNSFKKEDLKNQIVKNTTEPTKKPETQQITDIKVEQVKPELQKELISPTKVENVQQNKEVTKSAVTLEKQQDEKKEDNSIIKSPEKISGISSATDLIKNSEKQQPVSKDIKIIEPVEAKVEEKKFDQKLQNASDSVTSLKKENSKSKIIENNTEQVKKLEAQQITEKKVEQAKSDPQKVEQTKPDPQIVQQTKSDQQDKVTSPIKLEKPTELKKEENLTIQSPQKTSSTTELIKNTEKQTSINQDTKLIKPVEIKPEEKKIEQKPQNVTDSASSLKKEDSKSKITENKTEPVKKPEVQQITEKQAEQAKPDPQKIEQAKSDLQKDVTSPKKVEQNKEIPQPVIDNKKDEEPKKEEAKIEKDSAINDKPKEPIAPSIPQDSSKPQPELAESPSKQSKKVQFEEIKKQEMVQQSDKKPDDKAIDKKDDDKKPEDKKIDDNKEVDKKPRDKKPSEVPQDESAPISIKKDLSLSTATQARRLQKWIENMKKFKLFNCDKLPPPKHSESHFYGLQLADLSPTLVLPKQFINEDLYCFTLSISITLCNPIVGLFGRTATIKIGDAQSKPCKINEIKVNNWIFMHSDLDMQETFAICEVVCNIYKKDQQAEYLLVNNFSVGVLPVRLFQPSVDKKTSPRPSGTQKNISLYMTSPRTFMAFSEKNKTVESKLEGIKFPAPGYKLTANFINLQVDQSIQTQILKLIPANCLVSPQDNLPGFIKESIGQNFKTEILQDLKFEKLTQCWAHQIKVDNLEVIETMFQKFLKTQVNDSGYKTEIISRKISCTPSNSCFLGNAFQAVTEITLKDDKSKKSSIKLSIPSTPLKISNLATSPLTCLVFRITYKVKYSLQGQSELLREFVLGRQPFFPNFDFTYGSGFIKDKNVELELNMCPELFIINDLLWDANEQNLSTTEIFLKLKFIMSNSEDLKSEQDLQQLEQKFIETEILKKQKKELVQVQDQSKPSNANQTQVDEAVLRRMAQLQIENTRLAEQVFQIEKVKKDQEQKKATTKSQKEEILKPINDGDRSIPVDDDSHKGLLDVLLNRQDTDIKSLLNLLQRLISKTQEDKDQYKGVVSRLSGTILRLLESDQLAQMTVFGTKSGRLKAIQFNNLSEYDKISIIENSARGDGKPLSDMSVFDFGKLQIKPNLKMEVDDQFKASTISFQFVAIKTPQWLAHPINLPQRVFFTFKFYMFRQTTSEHLLLRLPKEAVQTIKHQQALQDIQNPNEGQKNSALILGKQYFLMKQDLGGKSEVKKDDKQPKLSRNSLELLFDFDPSQMITGKEKELQHNHELFCKYLNERVLTVEVWNADSLMHFGTFKIPLFLIMRQGDPSKVVGQEFDIVEADYAEKVGSIQMVITNSGRQLIINKDKSQSPQKKQDQSLSPQKIQKNKLIISSNPIQTFEIQETMQDKLENAQQKASQHSKIAMSEEDRKRLRVDRIKQAALTSGTKLTSIQNSDSNEWAKKEELKQIKLMREQNKQKLINQVASTAVQMNQSTLDVVSGTPSFLELEVNNPYEKSQNFKVQIVDADFDAGIIERPEMVLVQSDEWNHWASEGKCGQPKKNLGLLGDMLELDVGEKCKLLFKFLSFREPVVDSSSKDEKSVEQQMKRKVQELIPRKIHLEIIDSKGMSIQSLTVNIFPQEMIFDHLFRFYEAEGTISQSLIPNFVRHLATGQASAVDEDSGLLLKQCKIMCSDKQVKLEIVSNDCLQATVKNEKSKSSRKAFVFIYGDQYCSKLLASCILEFNALTQLQIKVKAGIEYDHMLEIAGSEVERTVEVYSSDPQLIYPPSGKTQNIFELKQGKKNELQTIPICLRAHSFGTHRARLNLIDLNTRELVSCFLVVIEAEKPIVDQAVVVRCQKGQKEFVKYAFKNPFSKEKVQFSVTTTDMKLLKPKNEIEELQPQEEKDICLIVQESVDIGTHEILMHLNRVNQDQDHHEMHTQTVLFNIQIYE